jgi:hypothetical protein
VGNPPADLDAKALLLHECMHVLVDIIYPDETALRVTTASYSR